MISSYRLLMFTLLMATSLSFTACRKSDNSASKGNIRRGNGKAADNKDQAGGNPAQNPADRNKTDTRTPPIKLEELDPSKGTDVADEEYNELRTDLTESSSDEDSTFSAKSSTCEQLEKNLSATGWEKSEISVYEDTDSESGKKINVSYFTLKNSEFKNPVLYLNGYANKSITLSALKRIESLSKTYAFDPIVMESRGTGCSSALPSKDSLKDWQHYGSRGQALDAEAIRKQVLKNDKWKVWAHQVAGYAALRLVELAPSGVKSVHISDFTPMTSFEDYMFFRIQSQAQAWKSLIYHLEKDKKVSITQAEIKKAQAFLDSQKCVDDQKVCGSALFDALAYLLSRGTKTDWDKAAALLQGFIAGKKDSEQNLEKIVNSLQQGRLLGTAMRMIDMDKDLDQTACTKAAQQAAQDSDLKSIPINTCRLDAKLGRSEVELLRNILKHDALDMDQIKNNMERNKIAYHWLVADRSLINPIKAAQEHAELFESVLGDNFKSDPQKIEVSTDKTLLETLKD